MKRVKAKGIPVVVYEPTLDAPEFFGSEVTHDLEAFKAGCDVIVANRWSDELADVADKVYTRNLFKRDWGRDGGFEANKNALAVHKTTAWSYQKECRYILTAVPIGIESLINGRLD